MTNEPAAMTSEEAIAAFSQFPVPATSVFLGIEMREIDGARGFARIAYLGKEDFCTEHGFIQVGFLSAMLDDAMAIAATAHGNFAYVVPTLGMKVSCLREVRPGPLVAEGSLRHTGDRLVSLEGALFDGAGELVATASATARLRKAPWL